MTSIFSGTLTINDIIICIVSSIILGFIISFAHKIGGDATKNFLVALVLLPLLVESVIVMVNGNLGTSVAILGAFSLIRFRSMPGTSRELVSIFLAMAVGLALGMGQVLFAFLFTIVASILMIILNKTKFGENKLLKLKIVIPEDLNYRNEFTDILTKYTKKYNLAKIKTTNLGSLYELYYNVILKEQIDEKEFIDELRCHNGNLNIVLNREVIESKEL